MDEQKTTEPRPVALIPAFVPEPAVVPIARLLAASKLFEAVLVVDDGSGPGSAEIFSSLEAVDGVTLLRHFANLGKGAALKTGLNYIGCHYPHAIGAVSLDADGQHRVEDVLNVARTLTSHPEDLVMGSREFPKTIPFRSRFGNLVTRFVMRLFGGLSLRDTQTGLRGIPRSLFPDLLRLRTSGYDFELDMLLMARRNNRAIREIPIETVYIDDNRSSHFNPLADSLKIYLVFLRFNVSSLVSVVIDYSVFSLSIAFGNALLSSQFIARSCAGTVNYFLNKQFVFKSDRSHLYSMSLYIATLVGMGLCSYGLILVIKEQLGINVLAAKIISELLLYLASFAIQREIVFSRRDSE